MANKLVKELTANEYVFLTLGAGLDLQKDAKVIMKSVLADRTIKELGDKVTLSDEFKFDFVDGDVAIDPTNTITENSHGMSDGDPVRLSSTGTLPAGLNDNDDYYVVNSTANDFQLAASEGGPAIQITAAGGGGTHTLNKMRAKLKFSNFEIIRA